jgi:hypothetical protein
MVVPAHIAGIPVEETVAMFGPFLLMTGGCCVAGVRSRIAKRRSSGPGSR